MPGPYFKNQQTESTCGCYYPDVTRLRDDAETRTRILHCIYHGDIFIPLKDNQFMPDEFDIPTEEWREKERQRMRGDHTC